MKSIYASIAAAALLMAGIAGCGGSSSDSGTLNVALIDAPADFQAVYVTIDKVMVHRADDTNESNATWLTVADVNGTYDLLKLRDGNVSMIGVTNIPAAKYTQMRLVLSAESNDSTVHPYGNYVVIDGNASELTVPSMVIKESHNFVMAADGNMTMTVDFDANRSIHSTGSNKWMLKPVLHVDTK
ncbi:DUF4382 domain-containing protein [Sulfurimonas sp. HSL1-6]|uniref:DUF4382 domain-containing protein n=1 Tax=Thiomicrolovo immobilis TaxID=3131935 RepID=UPI0031F946D2